MIEGILKLDQRLAMSSWRTEMAPYRPEVANGFTWGGVSVANPFAPKRHDLLEGLLESGSA